MTTELPLYYDGGQEYLQLHDNRTLWKVTNKKFTDEDWQILSDSVVERFKNTTRVDLYLLGRSGRHACVENTEENRKQYKSLKRRALTLEKWFIKQANKRR
jgi:hypothetical protein